MSDLQFRNDMVVRHIDHMGTDLAIAQAAWVDPDRLPVDDVEVPRLLNRLAKLRHGTPFEHTAVKLYVEAPLFVRSEWQRHRIASYNEYSGRYSEMLPDFYIPAPERGLEQLGTPMRPNLAMNEQMSDELRLILKAKNKQAWDSYQYLLSIGVAREAARMVLAVNIYTKFFVTWNLRSLMNFLSLRIDHTDNTFKTYPMAEIQDAAVKVEAIFAELFPQTYAAFCAGGRISP